MSQANIQTGILLACRCSPHLETTRKTREHHSGADSLGIQGLHCLTQMSHEVLVLTRLLKNTEKRKKVRGVASASQSAA